MSKLTGKCALVTGARTGIGAETAKALAAAGAVVAACGRMKGDCDQVVEEIRREGNTAFDHAIDVSELGAVKGRLDEAIAKMGALDIVINNAARIAPMGKLGTLDSSEFDQACRINLSGAMAVINSAWHSLKNGGRVLNLLSGAAVNPVEGWAAYCSTKAGLLMLTRMVHLEGQEHGIHGFGFAPGLVDTEMQGNVRSAKINNISDIPREQLAPPNIPAEVITWLVSGDADDLAGIQVDIRDENIYHRFLKWQKQQ